jgi:hypothetical protein
MKKGKINKKIRKKEMDKDKKKEDFFLIKKIKTLPFEI